MSPVVYRHQPLVVRDQALADMTTGGLLGILLGGESTSGTAIATAAALIDTGDCAIRSPHPEELEKLIGIDTERSRTLAAAFELARRAAAPAPPAVLRSPADVAAIAQRELGGRRRERLLAIVCDAANRPVRVAVVADGALDRCRFPIREILNAVVRFDGRGFALAHNHPSDDVQVSDADIEATRAVAEAARIVRIRFLGHVVVGESGWSQVTLPAFRTPC